MAEQLFQTFTAGGGNKQLVARHTPLATRPVLLDNAINAPLKSGAVLFAATVAGPFALATTGTLPAATDVVAILAHDIDLTGAAADVLANGYVGPGEFSKEVVLAASAALDAPSILAVEEALLSRGMNLVHLVYGSNSESAV